MASGTLVDRWRSETWRRGRAGQDECRAVRGAEAERAVTMVDSGTECAQPKHRDTPRSWIQRRLLPRIMSTCVYSRLLASTRVATVRPRFT